jgi:hypothetical protein
MKLIIAIALLVWFCIAVFGIQPLTTYQSWVWYLNAVPSCFGFWVGVILIHEHKTERC